MYQKTVIMKNRNESLKQGSGWALTVGRSDYKKWQSDIGEVLAHRMKMSLPKQKIYLF